MEREREREIAIARERGTHTHTQKKGQKRYLVVSPRNSNRFSDRTRTSGNFCPQNFSTFKINKNDVMENKIN